VPAPKDYDALWREVKAALEEIRRHQRHTLAGTGWTLADVGQVVQDGSVTIPNNGLLLVDGGDVVMLNADLVEVFRVGIMPAGDRGLRIKRADDTTALEMYDVFGSGHQSLVLWDKAHRIIAGDSILAASGFDAPHIPMPFHPVDPTVAGRAVTTSATTFTATHEHRGYRQNPALKPQFTVQCSDATTAAEVQVWDVLNATYLGGFLGTPATHTISVPAGTTAYTVFEFSSALQLPGLMSDDIQLEVHARVTAGTGSVTVAPVKSIGAGF
jgi:hypothetical protein